jgi:hypothetical protein
MQHFSNAKGNNILLKVRKTEDVLYESVIPLSCKRLLHPDVEEFIIQEAEKLQPNPELEITIEIIEKTSFSVNEITSVIHRHFESKCETEKRKISNALKLGSKSLLIAFIFLIIMFLVTRILLNIVPENSLLITLKEVFIILGWVALWRPAELLLYEWRPFKRDAQLFGRLAGCKITVVV